MPEFDSVIHHNLTCLYENLFVGRYSIIDKLHNLLSISSDKQQIILLHGAPYIGKTSLVKCLCQTYLSVKTRTPFDTIIWIDAYEHCLFNAQLDIKSRMSHLLSTLFREISFVLEHDHITKQKLKNQIKEIKKLIITRKVLLILDNLPKTHQDIISLLKSFPLSTKILITSRDILKANVSITIENFSPCEITNFLSILLKDNKLTTYKKYKLNTLLSRCDANQPFLIKLLLFNLTSNYITFKDEQLSYYSFFKKTITFIQNKPAYTLLLILSQYPFLISFRALIEISKLSILKVNIGLKILEDQLFIRKEGSKIYLRQWIREYISFIPEFEKETKAIKDSIIFYYKKMCAKYQDSHRNWKNITWLKAEGDNLVALTNWAIYNKQYSLVIELGPALVRYLAIKKRLGDVINYATYIGFIAEKYNRIDVSAWLYIYWLSWLYQDIGHSKKAQRYTDKGIKLYKQCGDELGVCIALKYLSRIYRSNYKYSESETACLRALELSEQVGDFEARKEILAELGRLFCDKKEWQNAKYYFSLAIKNYNKDKINSYTITSFYMWSIGYLGWVEFNLGNLEKAKILIQHSLEHYKKCERGRAIILYYRLAEIEKALGKTEQALYIATKALFIAKQIRTEKLVKQLETFIGEC